MPGYPAKQSVPNTGVIPDENSRLRAVRELGIINTPAEKSYDRIVGLVKKIFKVEIAAISIMDGHRFWLKSAVGTPVTEAQHADSFSQFTLAIDGPFVVSDTFEDPRFRDNPFVAGPPHVRFYAGVPVRSSNGQGIGTLCAVDTKPRKITEGQLAVLQDFADIVAENFQLRRVAMRDELTGTLSRRAFREQGVQIASLAARHRHNFTAICFDLDHFKSINDTFGHAAGDEVLREMAKAAQTRLRSSDLLGRMGGEEFAVLLPETDRQGALEAAEKLRRDISALRFEFGGRTVGITASFGIGTFNIETRDLDSLLERADAALYQAKSEGRNRCVAFGKSDVTVRAARRRVLKAGKISFRNGGSTIDCTVRTLGQEGAGLDMIATTDVPNEFRLLIKADGLDAKCEVTSRTRTHLEVEFV